MSTSSSFSSIDIKSANATQCGDKANELVIRYSVDQNVREYRELNITSAARFCTGVRPPKNFFSAEEQYHHVVVAGKNISTTTEDNATLSTWPAEVQKRIQDKLASENGTWGYFIADPSTQVPASGNFFGDDNEFQGQSEKDFTRCYGREYDYFVTFQIPSSAFPPVPGNLSDLGPDGKAEFLVLQFVEDLGVPKVSALKLAVARSASKQVTTNIGMCPSEKLVTEDYLKFKSARGETDMYDLMVAAGLFPPRQSSSLTLDNDTVFLPPRAKVNELAVRSNSTIEGDYAKYHVINDQDVTAAQLKTAGQSFATLLSGAPLSFDSSNASLLVEEVVTKNGRVHKTSDVLTPPELRQVVTDAPTLAPSSAPSVSPAVLVPLLLLAARLFC